MSIITVLCGAVIALSAQSSAAQNTSVGLDGFGYELTVNGLDAVNFNMQKEHLRAKEHFQSMSADIEAVQRTLRNIESMVNRQTKEISSIRNDVEVLTLNMSHSLSDTSQIYRLQQTLATTEMLNDFIISATADRIQSAGASAKLLEVKNSPQTCRDVPEIRSGVRQLQPQSGFAGSFAAFCDQDYESGGWTVIQNRYDGSVHFFRGWNEYEHGFGDLRGEFWLGLKRIHELTYAKKHELHVVMEDFEGQTVVAKYSNFLVAGPEEKYALKSLGEYSGDAGNSLGSAVNLKFTTLDSDNDTHGPGNCAIDYQGGWWYGACHESNLNGLYMKGTQEVFAKMMCWKAFKGYHYGLKRSRMMIRALSN